MTKTNYGFDDNFFKIFNKKISSLNENEKHRMVLFYEIFLSQSISVNSKTLTYSELENFGNDDPSLNKSEKADHGLIMMFQSLGLNITQPIAVFCSKGPVNGN